MIFRMKELAIPFRVDDIVSVSLVRKQGNLKYDSIRIYI